VTDEPTIAIESDVTEAIVSATATRKPIIASLGPGIYPMTSLETGFNIYTLEGDLVGQIPFLINSRADISADGRLILFDNPELGILNVYTDETETLDEFPPGIDPSWSPNTSQFVVISTEDPNDFGSLFIYSLEDNQVSRITFSEGLETDPSWSPDGRFIAYASDEKSEMIGSTELYIVQSSCYQDETCQASSERIHGLAMQNWASEPSWSPDSSMIVFTCGRGSKGLDLCIYDLIDSSFRVLIESQGDERGPHWSIDGDWIGFTRKVTDSSTAQAYIVHINTKDEVQLSSGQNDEFFATWLVIK
jgi:Tol biopolymer transport system component